METHYDFSVKEVKNEKDGDASQGLIIHIPPPRDRFKKSSIKNPFSYDFVSLSEEDEEKIKKGEFKPKQYKVYVKLNQTEVSYYTAETKSIRKIPKEEFKNEISSYNMDTLPKDEILRITAERGHTYIPLLAPAVDVLIALHIYINSGGRPEFLAVLLRKTGKLLNANGTQSLEPVIALLQEYKKYITLPEEDSEKYEALFKRYIKSSGEPTYGKDEFKNENTLIADSLSNFQQNSATYFDVLGHTLSKNSIETTLAASPRLGAQDDLPLEHPCASKEEVEALLRYYSIPQALVLAKEEDPTDYASEEQKVFEKLDYSIYKMILNKQDLIVTDLLKHRTLLANYLLKNKDYGEKIRLVKQLSCQAARYINNMVPDEERLTNLTLETINEETNLYYNSVVNSGLALSADSLSKKVIKSIVAIILGVVAFVAFCALLAGLCWIICHTWAPALLTNLSLQLHTDLLFQVGVSVTLTGLAALFGIFSHHYLRGKGCLDSEIAQSSKDLANDVRKADLPQKPLFK